MRGAFCCWALPPPPGPAQSPDFLLNTHHACNTDWFMQLVVHCSLLFPPLPQRPGDQIAGYEQSPGVKDQSGTRGGIPMIYIHGETRLLDGAAE